MINYKSILIIGASSDLALGFVSNLRKNKYIGTIIGTVRKIDIKYADFDRIHELDVTSENSIDCCLSEFNSYAFDAVFIFVSYQGDKLKTAFGSLERSEFNRVLDVNCTSIIIFLQKLF